MRGGLGRRRRTPMASPPGLRARREGRPAADSRAPPEEKGPAQELDGAVRGVRPGRSPSALGVSPPPEPARVLLGAGRRGRGVLPSGPSDGPRPGRGCLEAPPAGRRRRRG